MRSFLFATRNRAMRLRTLLVTIAAFCTLTPLPRPAAAQAVGREEAEFVASSRGQVYYWIGCDAWHRLSRQNLRFSRSAEDAESAGYRPSRSRGCAPQLVTAPIRPEIGGRADCVVSRIVDGDTFECRGGSRIRLLLIDTDELGQSKWADSATAFLKRRMPVGSRVLLEFDIELFDRYDRILAYVRKDDRFINHELVRRGLAHIYVLPPNVAHADLLRAAADSARAEWRGMWAQDPFACTPSDYRAGRCR